MTFISLQPKLSHGNENIDDDGDDHNDNDNADNIV